jgi:hypothetical protein
MMIKEEYLISGTHRGLKPEDLNKIREPVLSTAQGCPSAIFPADE